MATSKQRHERNRNKGDGQRPRNVSDIVNNFFTKEDSYDETDNDSLNSSLSVSPREMQVILLNDTSNTSSESNTYCPKCAEMDENKQIDYQWQWRHTVSYWISVGGVYGLLPFVVGNTVELFKDEEYISAVDYHTLRHVAFFFGGIANLVAGYCGYHEVINEHNRYNPNRHKKSRRTKIWCCLPGPKSLPYWTSLIFLIANFLTLIPKTFAVFYIEFEEGTVAWYIIDQITICIVTTCLLIGGCLQVYINNGWVWRPYKLGWIIAWSNAIAGFCFFVPGVFTTWFISQNGKAFKFWMSDMWFLIGTLFYFFSGILSLMMWKLQQYGLVYLPQLNKNKRIDQSKMDVVLYRDIFFIILYCITASGSTFAISYALQCKDFEDWIKNYFLALMGSVAILAISSFVHKEPAKPPFSYLLWFLRCYMTVYTINLMVDVYHISVKPTMSFVLLYIGLVVLIIGIEVYKSTSIRTEDDIIAESWEQYNVRVHSKVPKYNGPNPFERQTPGFYELMKRIIMTPIAIIRVMLFISIVIFGAIVSFPASKLGFQRKATSQLLRLLLRVILFIFGFYHIPVVNENASHIDINKAARIIIANHHTVFDGIALLYYTKGVVAATAELANIPFFGQVLIAFQTLFIDRHGKHGRTRAKQQILDHIHNDNLPPLIIFPQATTTSIYTLTTFKAGAFLSKRAVLPIVFDWSYNKYHDLSYVGETTLLRDMFFAGCQVINYCHITICKPYKPQKAEDLEPYKFAENARILMSRYLKSYCKLTPHSLTDHLLYDFAKNRNKYKMDMDFVMSDIVSMLKLKSKTVQYLAQKFSNLDKNGSGFIDFSDFCVAFGRDPIKHFDKMSKLFQLFSVNNNERKIAFDEFLNGVSICFVDSSINDAIRVMFDSCSTDNKVVREKDILKVYDRQIDKSRFQDEDEYNKYFTKVQYFVNEVFDYQCIEEMNFNEFHSVITEKDLKNYVQEYLQIIVMMRLKIKLHKNDFKTNDVQSDEKEKSGNQVFDFQHPRLLKSDSIRSVGATNLAPGTNKV